MSETIDAHLSISEDAKIYRLLNLNCMLKV